MNSSLTSHEQRGHLEMGPWCKVSTERLEKLRINLLIPGWVVQRVIHYTTAPLKFEEVAVCLKMAGSIE